MFKNARSAAASMYRRGAVQVAAVGTALAALADQAMAAIDTTATQTALTAAQTSGETVGSQVIGVVAGLVVVGVIIALVRKV